VSIRPFRDDDAGAAAQIFFDSVRLGTQDYYDEAQRHAWAPRVPETAMWLDRLKPQTVFVAERQGRVVGFMSLTAEGCIGLAYVAPDTIGQGIGKALYDAILSEAENIGVPKLTAQASHLARAFFERQGWSVVKSQTVTRGDDVAIPIFVMEKNLSSTVIASKDF
jgi:putative acetyltransferase